MDPDRSGRGLREALGRAASDAERARVVAGAIDHTLLSPAAGAREIEALCRQAIELGFASVCTNPLWTKQAAELVKGTPVLVTGVAGFPLGAAVPDVKAREAARGVEDGADEIDMVAAVGLLRDGEEGSVAEDIKGVVRAAAGKPVKVILECCDLSDDQIRTGCRLAVEAGAAFVKTSTGFGRHGATEAHVRLLRECVGNRAGVKASGGIRTPAACIGMIRAGASRIGTSFGAAIVGAWKDS